VTPEQFIAELAALRQAEADARKAYLKARRSRRLYAQGLWWLHSIGFAIAVVRIQHNPNNKGQNK